MKMLRLVSLASCASPDEVLDQPTHVGEVEVTAETVQSALHAFMAVVVHSSHDLLQQRR
jgi:hypothetical protein